MHGRDAGDVEGVEDLELVAAGRVGQQRHVAAAVAAGGPQLDGQLVLKPVDGQLEALRVGVVDAGREVGAGPRDAGPRADIIEHG